MNGSRTCTMFGIYPVFNYHSWRVGDLMTMICLYEKIAIYVQIGCPRGIVSLPKQLERNQFFFPL